jgi:asparagine synthase (glutamine-hydrolysing)
MRDLLPPEVLAGPKRGFGIPIKYWFREKLKAFARDVLVSPASRIGRFVRPEMVLRILASHDRGGRDLSERIWVLLVLEQWCRTARV